MPNPTKKSLVIANWKMKLSLGESVALAKAITLLANKYDKEVKLVVCPSFPVLYPLSQIFKGKKVSLGAQDVFWKAIGSYTGEVSPSMLKELGVEYVLVGHSERRQYLKETDQIVHHKTLSALSDGLIPIVCVGETFTERQQGNKDLVVARQVEKALAGVELKSTDQLIVAYEPVWVIGSGQAVEVDEAEHSSQVIKQSLINLFPANTVSKQMSIIYGGSVDASNINDFIPSEIIAGVLVGSASLTINTFSALVKTLTS